MTVAWAYAPARGLTGFGGSAGGSGEGSGPGSARTVCGAGLFSAERFCFEAGAFQMRGGTLGAIAPVSSKLLRRASRRAWMSVAPGGSARSSSICRTAAPYWRLACRWRSARWPYLALVWFPVAIAAMTPMLPTIARVTVFYECWSVMNTAEPTIAASTVLPMPYQPSSVS